MGSSTGTINLENVTDEKIEEFYEWLQGKSSPNEICFEHTLNLTEEEAFMVIYYLQEHMEILPDKYERCCKCGSLYDSENEGVCVREDSTVVDDNGNEINADFPKEYHGFYCDDCRPDDYYTWRRIKGMEESEDGE